MRRRSRQFADLDVKIESLTETNQRLYEENMQLQSINTSSEQVLEATIYRHLQERSALVEALEIRSLTVTERENQLQTLRRDIERLQDNRLVQEVQHLRLTNETLTGDNSTIKANYERKREQLHTLLRQHTELQKRYAEVTSGLETYVSRQVSNASLNKDAEIANLRDELAATKAASAKLQAKVTRMNRSNDPKDEAYFVRSCNHLFSTIQQWCVKFSKFSDDKKCEDYFGIEEEVKHLADSVMLNGTPVQNMLQDRVKRREVFQSMVVSLIWELIFCRYLFGLDSDERKKLKALEEKLNEVGKYFLISYLDLC